MYDHLSPRAALFEFWLKYHTKDPNKITSIFPHHLHESLLPGSSPSYPYVVPSTAFQDYETAAQECRLWVEFIVKECEAANTKFVDACFDMETDFCTYTNSCLLGLEAIYEQGIEGDESDVDTKFRNKCTKSRQNNVPSKVLTTMPGSVHRIPWIFDNPQFKIRDFSSSSIMQGASGNCWWLAALGTIAHRQDVMKKVCVAQNEEIGVYGFVFFRDGEWISTVVDDYLYLTAPDFDGEVYDIAGAKARAYKKQKQTNSEALFFARCRHPNETWLPLLEKAFAKVHGDYEALDGGWASTAVEDLTGGVTTTISADSVLHKNRLWHEMLHSENECGSFLFSLSSGSGSFHKNGIVSGHAYSVLRAVEVVNDQGNVVHLMEIRNPWGERSDSGHGEWKGPWSDGSREWSSSMLSKLSYKFDDDGVFWMTFQDVLDNFKWIYRTRLFDERWTTHQLWVSIEVPWLSGYLKKRFLVEIKEKDMFVIVLSQLDRRYFEGLQGKYDFSISFHLRDATGRKLMRQVRPVHHWDQRSVNCEITLEPGIYEVVPMVVAEPNARRSIQEIIELTANKHSQKLQQIGLQHDYAHEKAAILTKQEPVKEGDGNKLVETEKEPRQPPESCRRPYIKSKETSLASGNQGGDWNTGADSSDLGQECKPKQSLCDLNHSDSQRQHEWSAVCTIGLRIHAQHHGVKITWTADELKNS